jgi:hypothetical protein
MNKIISSVILSILILLISNSLTGQKSDFNGTWKLDLSKIPATGNFPVLTKIIININGDSLITERFYDTGDGQVYPFDENLTLDGKENLITVYEMPRKSKATWKEKGIVLIHEATTTANGSNGPVDFKSTETWTVDSVNNILTISFKNNIFTEELTGSFIFNKSVNSN